MATNQGSGFSTTVSTSRPVGQQDDLDIDGLLGKLSNLKPAPVSMNLPAPEMPPQPNLDLMRDVLDRATAAKLAHGLGTRVPNWFQVMHGGKTYTPDTPISQAVQEQATAPLKIESARMQAEQARADTLNKYNLKSSELGLEAQKANNAVPLAEMKGMLSAVVANQRNRLGYDRLSETNRHNVVSEEKKPSLTGKPTKGSEDAQMQLLRATADHIHNLKSVIDKYGSLGNLSAKIGPYARTINAARATGLVPQSLEPNADQQQMLDDMTLGESSIKGLLGSKALATEPRRVAYELQKKLNAELGEGASDPVFRQQLGVIAKHVSRAYGGGYGAHADYYTGKDDMPKPEDFDKFIMDGLTAPESVNIGKAASPAGPKLPSQGGGPVKPRTVVKTQTNKRTGKKRVVYSDGTTEEQ
jgi:hypothetical protein